VSKVSCDGDVGVPVTRTGGLGDLRSEPGRVTGLAPADLPPRLSAPGAEPSSAQPRGGGWGAGCHGAAPLSKSQLFPRPAAFSRATSR